MPLETLIRLKCDYCNQASEWFNGAIYTRSRLFTELRLEGWIRRKNFRRGNTECPACSKIKDKVYDPIPF